MNDDNGLGPPKEVGPVCDRATPTTAAMQVDASKSSPLQLRQCSADTVLAQLHRRREASRRVAPLDCGCPDPWPCRCSQPPLSHRMVDAGRDAAQHLLDCGLPPLVDAETRLALSRRGGEDRKLAEELHALTGQVVA